MSTEISLFFSADPYARNRALDVQSRGGQNEDAIHKEKKNVESLEGDLEIFKMFGSATEVCVRDLKFQTLITKT